VSEVLVGAARDLCSDAAGNLVLGGLAPATQGGRVE